MFLKNQNSILDILLFTKTYQVKQMQNLKKIIHLLSFLILIACINKSSAQEGCEVNGLILNDTKGSIENVFIISFDSTKYETRTKLNVIDDLRAAYLLKSDTLNTHSMGVSNPKGEFLFIMGSSKYAIIYHPDYELKIIDRSKLENPCKFDLITLEKKI